MQAKKNRGKKIETIFRECAEKDGLFIIRLKDSATSWQGGAARFTPDNPCDFIIFQSPYLFALELKSTIGMSFSIQLSTEDASAMIKAHQINSLIKMSQYKNSVCGFIFNVHSEKTDEEQLWYLSIQNFSKFIAETDKKSINVSDIETYGGIRAEVVRKRVWSTFKVGALIEDIVEKEARCGSL